MIYFIQSEGWTTVLKLPAKKQEEWKAACWDELEVLRRWEVFEMTNLPKGQKIIRNRWVSNIKSDGYKKACLVAKGFSQVEGIDFFELFSAVVHFETVWLMLALSSLEGWHIQGVDILGLQLIFFQFFDDFQSKCFGGTLRVSISNERG